MMQASLPGFRVASTRPRLLVETCAAFASLPTANIADAMHRLGAMAGGIGPVWVGAAFTGSALTVWTRGGDNLMLHKAINMARPGDVLVVNGQGDVSRALLGDLMGHSAREFGVAGIVIDGAVRDVEMLEALRLPVFARAIAPGGPFKDGPGEIGYPVACGGVVCRTGDLVVGDADGVVIVPQDDVKSVLEEANAIHVREARRREAILSGHPQRDGIDQVLESAGVLAVRSG